jgi:protein involved in polysaccharide export with SLBB domain
VLRINGEVKNVGEYPYIENIKLYDLILMAGGFTDGASRVVEITSMIIKDAPSGQSSKVSDVKVIQIDTLLVNQVANIALAPYDVVTVRRKPTFEQLELITVSGQVEYPGSYVISDKNERVLDFINRAGGLKYYANPEGLRIVRTSEMANADGTKGMKEVIIPINYEKIIKRPRNKENFIVQRGDVLIVPEKKGTVGVFGQVQLNSEIPYFSKKLKKYINYSGGFGEHPHKKRIYVIQPNGLAKATKRFLGIPIYPRIKSGATSIVPTKSIEEKDKMSAGEWAVIAAVITSLASTSAIVAVTLTK